MRSITVLAFLMLVHLMVSAQNVTVHAVDQPAAAVFRTLVSQTGKNFVYSSDILRGMTVTVKAENKPLKKVLEAMFRGSDIEFKIRGNEVILKRKKSKATVHRDAPRVTTPVKSSAAETMPTPKVLQEVVVTSRLEASPTETVEIGAKKLTASEIRNTPTLFGEADVIKALQAQPGITEGTEGLAGMHVHGGNTDENLYMLDNVPIYQANHFAGLFSAFNTEAIGYIDFFKSSIPAKYDGRLSSFLDVRTKNGSLDGHHGSARLGLTSGAFNIDGPIGHRTTYSVALRRSWYDMLTIPAVAVANSSSEDERIRFHYYFMDLNGKVTHRFSDNTTGFINVYFGDDLLKTGTTDKDNTTIGWHDDDKYNFHWGNLVAQTGLTHRFRDNLSSEFTAAYTRFFASVKRDESSKNNFPDYSESSRSLSKYHNNINDWIFKADFDWLCMESSRVRFGANYVRHSFLPSSTMRVYETDDIRFESRDSTWAYPANEFNIYVEDFMTLGNSWLINAGVHASMFNIEGRTKHGFSPRLSVSYRPREDLSVKGAYSRTTQYVHQLSQSYLALPTDQWIPVTGDFKPQTADKISVGAYWQSRNGLFTASVECYRKWMHNLIDYRDEYYLRPPLEMWNARLVEGKGSARGIDFKIEKPSGKMTGHIAYSLAWSDRTFKDKNMGRTFPARFDNRHTINLLVNWNINHNVSVNASWTGHSGNRFTLLPQMWDAPDIKDIYPDSEVPLRSPVNNYQLPFYHRLDLSCTVKNRRGYWTFGLFNAYCHLNTVAIRRTYSDSGKPVFQKVKLLPIIPSISYTWKF